MNRGFRRETSGQMPDGWRLTCSPFLAAFIAPSRPPSRRPSRAVNSSPIVSRLPRSAEQGERWGGGQGGGRHSHRAGWYGAPHSKRQVVGEAGRGGGEALCPTQQRRFAACQPPVCLSTTAGRPASPPAVTWRGCFWPAARRARTAGVWMAAVSSLATWVCEGERKGPRGGRVKGWGCDSCGLDGSASGCCCAPSPATTHGRLLLCPVSTDTTACVEAPPPPPPPNKHTSWWFTRG